MGAFMRGLASISATLALCFTAATSVAADTSPIGCAWDKLPEAERQRLIDEFKVDLKDNGFTILFANHDTAKATEAANQCALSTTPAQNENLALGLSRHAALEKSIKGISSKGEDPAAIGIALDKMIEGKRERIGDKLSCPGPHERVTEWDGSIKNAIKRANVRFTDQRAYSWLSLGLYASMAEEGALRRMAGRAGACSG
jgi:hypothetical protein